MNPWRNSWKILRSNSKKNVRSTEEISMNYKFFEENPNIDKNNQLNSGVNTEDIPEDFFSYKKNFYRKTWVNSCHRLWRNYDDILRTVHRFIVFVVISSRISWRILRHFLSNQRIYRNRDRGTKSGKMLEKNLQEIQGNLGPCRYVYVLSNFLWSPSNISGKHIYDLFRFFSITTQKYCNDDYICCPLL